MNMILSKIIEMIFPLLWGIIWFLGGYLIVVNTLKVRRYETTLLGFGVGLVLQVWLANWTGRMVEPVFAFWLSAGLVLVAGLALTLGRKSWKEVREAFYFPPAYWIVFLICAYLFLMIGRGLAIFDDYQNLPVTSILAAGQIPPRFVLNPEVSFDYHYLMLLNAAQWMRIANLFPWTAVDTARGIFFGLVVVYAAFVGRRLTRSETAGWLTAAAVTLSGSFRWLLLLLPAGVVSRISAHIQLMGSGLSTGDTLQMALTNAWQIEGGGPVAFPFAFVTNLSPPTIMGHTGTGSMGLVILLMLILLYENRRSKWGLVVLSMLLAAMAMVVEIWFGFLLCGALLIYFVIFLRERKQFQPDFWYQVVFLIVLPGILALVQGGVLTGMANGLLAKIAGETAAETQYFSVNFPIRWPPTIISGHMGRLELTQWAQLLVAMLEIGPVFLMIPLFFIWCYKAFQQKRLLYGMLAVGAAMSMLAVFIEYEGSAGISATGRLYTYSLNLLVLFSVPLLWHWLKRRRKIIQTAAIGLAALTLVSGIVYFAIESIAIQRPVQSYYLKPLDAAIANEYWDALEEDAMVFDFVAPRAATLFARPLVSHVTWYVSTPEYQELLQNPDPYLIQMAGYDYLYMTLENWSRLEPDQQAALQDDCVKTLYEVSDWQGDFRRILDIRTCTEN